MAVDSEIEEQQHLVRGEDKILSFACGGDNADMNTWTVQWEFSRVPGDDPILIKTSEVGGGIGIDAGEHTVSVTISRDDTDLLSAGRYWHRLFRTDDGNFSYLAFGQVDLLMA